MAGNWCEPEQSVIWSVQTFLLHDITCWYVSSIVGTYESLKVPLGEKERGNNMQKDLVECYVMLCSISKGLFNFISFYFHFIFISNSLIKRLVVAWLAVCKFSLAYHHLKFQTTKQNKAQEKTKTAKRARSMHELSVVYVCQDTLTTEMMLARAYRFALALETTTKLVQFGQICAEYANRTSTIYRHTCTQ